MATTGPITVKVKLPEETRALLQAMQDITLLCIEADQSGHDSITIEAIADILEGALDVLKESETSQEAEAGVPVHDVDWALEVLQRCGIKSADQFDALVAVQKLTPA